MALIIRGSTFEQYPDRYRTWWGFDTLPAVNKENADYQRYLLDPEDGILPRLVKKGACGWRLDVVDELPMPLVSAMRAGREAGRPGGGAAGRGLGGTRSNKVVLRRAALLLSGRQSGQRDADYPLRRAVIDFFTVQMRRAAASPGHPAPAGGLPRAVLLFFDEFAGQP